MKQVLIASSDRLWRDAAASYLRGARGWIVCGVAEDGISAITALVRLRPDAILVGGRLDRLAPGPFARQVRQRWPETNIVVVGNRVAEFAHSLPPTADAAAVLDALKSAPSDKGEATSILSRDGIKKLGSLTGRERTVLRLLAEGLTQLEIADRLSIRPNTVRTHMQNIYAKLGLHNRVEIVHFALSYGMASAPSPDQS